MCIRDSTGTSVDYDTVNTDALVPALETYTATLSAYYLSLIHILLFEVALVFLVQLRLRFHIGGEAGQIRTQLLERRKGDVGAAQQVLRGQGGGGRGLAVPGQPRVARGRCV